MTDRYTTHEHVFELTATQNLCHIVNSYSCTVPFCGSARNEWPETDEFINCIRDEAGEWVLTSRVNRHWRSLGDAAEYLGRLFEFIDRNNLPPDLPGEPAYVRNGKTTRAAEVKDHKLN